MDAKAVLIYNNNMLDILSICWAKFLQYLENNESNGLKDNNDRISDGSIWEPAYVELC